MHRKQIKAARKIGTARMIVASTFASSVSVGADVGKLVGKSVVFARVFMFE